MLLRARKLGALFGKNVVSCRRMQMQQETGAPTGALGLEAEAAEMVQGCKDCQTVARRVGEGFEKCQKLMICD